MLKRRSGDAVRAAGLAGAVLVAASALLPLVRLPGGAGRSAWEIGAGHALVLAGIGVGAAGILRSSRPGWAWVAGAATLAALLRALGAVDLPGAGGRAVFATGGVGIRAALGELAAGGLAPGWGLAAGVLGAVLVTAAGAAEAAGGPGDCCAATPGGEET